MPAAETGNRQSFAAIRRRFALARQVRLRGASAQCEKHKKRLAKPSNRRPPVGGAECVFMHSTTLLCLARLACQTIFVAESRATAGKLSWRLSATSFNSLPEGLGHWLSMPKIFFQSCSIKERASGTEYSTGFGFAGGNSWGRRTTLRLLALNRVNRR